MHVNNIYSRLAALAFAAFLSGSANASSIITESLFGEVLSGPFTGTTGSGTFSYDDDLLTGVGIEILGPDDFTLDFTIFGQTFTSASDIDYPDFAELNFEDGTPTVLDFIVVDINDPNIGEFSTYELIASINGGFETEVIVNAVPVPASIWLLGSGLLGLVGVARRKKS